MKYRTEPTPQGEQSIIPGAEPITPRDAMERRMQGAAKATKPQKRIEGTELWGGLPPHQDELFQP